MLSSARSPLTYSCNPYLECFPLGCKEQVGQSQLVAAKFWKINSEETGAFYFKQNFISYPREGGRALAASGVQSRLYEAVSGLPFWTKSLRLKITNSFCNRDLRKYPSSLHRPSESPDVCLETRLWYENVQKLLQSINNGPQTTIQVRKDWNQGHLEGNSLGFRKMSVLENQ